MTEATDVAIPRLPSGVSGLDTILSGGFLKAGVYIVQGIPGAGKTVLGNQMVFNHVAGGGQALYITLLAESHSRMLLHMRGMRFFDPSRIPSALSYISAFRTLEEEGLKGLGTLIRREVQARNATLLILDGLVTAGESAKTQTEFKKFIHELQAYASMTDCTMFLLTSARGPIVSPEHTMVDGLIELRDALHGARAERALEVLKFRGSRFLRGQHSFRITDTGIVVYPRIEGLYARPGSEGALATERKPTGIKELDDSIEGGLPPASTTLLLGASGTGKTSIGLHFISQCRAEEPGVVMGFFETPERLRLKARAIGLDLDGLVERGHVEIVWQPPTENTLDALGHCVLEAVRRRGARRLFVDGLGGFQQAAWLEDRIPHFFAALTNELRVLGATALYTVESRDLISPELRLPLANVSSIAENIIVLRYTELRSRMHRLVSVLKMRDSDFDARLREFFITDQGIQVAGAFEGAEDVVTGAAHEKRNSAPTKGRPRNGPRQDREP